MIAAALWAYWWRNALQGTFCTRCLQPGHVAASCTHKLWRHT